MTTPKAKKMTSDVWYHFVRLDKKGKCQYCNKVLSTPSGSSSNLKRHLKSKHPGVRFERSDPTVKRPPIQTAGDELEWSNETVLEFLDWYEQEPVIWNPSLPEHKNRNLVYDAWKRIELNMGLEYSVTQLKKKRESLMASFRACLSKVKANNNTEASYEPQWFAYEKMASFLLDKDQQKVEEEIIDDDDVIVNSEEIIVEGPVSEITTYDQDSMGNNVHEYVLDGRLRKSPLKKKRKVLEAQEQRKDKLDSSFSLMQCGSRISGNERKVCAIYGELVAAKLQSMDDRTRETCMHRINKILYDMRMTSFSSSDYHQQTNSADQADFSRRSFYRGTQRGSSPSSTSSSIVADHTYSLDLQSTPHHHKAIIIEAHQSSSHQKETSPTSQQILTLPVITDEMKKNIDD